MEPWIYNIQFETKTELEPELVKKVKERFPVIEDEKTCATERRLRNAARESYARKLLKNEQS